MDAGQYLQMKKAAQTNYIHRTIFKDAGFRTETIGKAAAASASASAAGTCCSALLDNTLYTTPYITTPCCPITYNVSTVQLPVQNTYCVQGTQSTQSYAVMLAVNKARGDCCTSNSHSDDPEPC